MDPIKLAQLIEAVTTSLVGLLNVLDATGRVSDIIGRQVDEGRTEWTTEERQTVEDDVAASFVRADAQITAAGG